MKKFSACLLATTLLLCGAQAQAQETSGPGASSGDIYLSVFVGDNLGRGQVFSGATVGGAPRDIRTPTKDGVIGGAAIGVIVAETSYGRFRAEAELSGSKNDITDLVLNGVPRDLVRGRKSVTAGMLNVAYDTPRFFDRLRFTAGAGLGLAAIDYDVQYNVAAAGPAISISTNESGRLAYQAIGGASVRLTDRIELTGDVRYFKVGSHQVERFNLTTGTLDSVLGTAYRSTRLTGGLRYIF